MLMLKMAILKKEIIASTFCYALTDAAFINAFR